MVERRLVRYVAVESDDILLLEVGKALGVDVHQDEAGTPRPKFIHHRARQPTGGTSHEVDAALDVQGIEKAMFHRQTSLLRTRHRRAYTGDPMRSRI